MSTPLFSKSFVDVITLLPRTTPSLIQQLVIARYLAAAAQEGAVDNSGSTVPPSAREPLVLLRQLLALRLLEEWSAELVASGYLTSAQRKTLEEAVSHYCRELRPRALSLVDAFDLSDHFLNSALGRSDGES